MLFICDSEFKYLGFVLGESGTNEADCRGVEVPLGP